ATFNHFRAPIAAGGRGLKGEDAARLTNLFMNDYSRSMLTDAEKQLANVFFTYSWNKGRLRLFGNLAKALIPGTLPSTAEKAVLQQAVARWTAVNMVMPHIWRIAVSKVPTAGVFGSRIPIGQQVDPGTGRSRPLYADPSGYYADAMQFLDHPISY